MAGDTGQILQRHLLHPLVAQALEGWQLVLGAERRFTREVWDTVKSVYSSRRRCFQDRGGYYDHWCWNLLDALYNSPPSGRWCLQHHQFHRFDLTGPSTMNHTHIDNTFSSIEGGTTPKLANASSILSPVYHHTHIDNTFSSIEGGTTPKLKNASSILSPVYHHTHRDNIFQCRGGYYPNTEKCAVYPIPCLPSLYPYS